MKIYQTDGSVACFFTAVFDCFREKDCVITSNSQFQLSFGSEIVRVESNDEKNARVQKKINCYDKECADDIVTALRSCDPLKEMTALGYIKKLMETKTPIKKRLNMPEVLEFNDLLYKVTGETHRLKGLLRFMESRSGALYAPYSPDNDITDLLTAHFAERLKQERFVIHDLKRKIAGMYDGNEWFVGNAGEIEVYLSEYERAFENLWKKYYKAVNIKERPHGKQMKGSMPVRYWKFLPEKKN